MATKTLQTKIILRNDLASAWQGANPIPSKAEICLETDTGKYKIGDGVSHYLQLPYYIHLTGDNATSLDSLIDMMNNDEFGAVDDVQVNGTSIVTNKLANVIIAELTFSDDGNDITAQSLNTKNVVLHKIARTGNYNDLINKLQSVDSLDSQDTTNPLSARQGSVLKSMIQSIPSATSFSNISSMVNVLNSASENELNIGTNLFIQTLNVPDFWIYSKEATPVTYLYTADDDLINSIRNNGSIQIGYYRISLLESDKVDLTNYVTIDTFNNAVNTINTRIDSILDDNTILKSTDNLILNGGTSADWE